MRYAYDKVYLYNAQRSMAAMLHYACIDCGMMLEDYYDLFLNSEISKQFGMGDPFVVAGMSGIEMAIEVMQMNEQDIIMPSSNMKKSMEYWTGWVLAYYQWITGKEFRRINREIPIQEIRELYNPYHEMDISQVIDRIDIQIKEKGYDVCLKYYRKLAGLSQSELARLTGIPIKTIQQYEQGRKDINKAQVDYIFRLSEALCCNPKDLLEI